MPADDADGAPLVAMISYRAWQRDYAGDPAVIGSSFYLNTHPVTIVGVTPQAFYGDQLSEETTDFYLPISQEPTLGFFAARDKQGIGWLFLIGRIKPGTALGPLQEKMSGLLRQSLGQLGEFQTEHGKQELAKVHVVLTPGSVGIANMQHQAEKSLYLLMGLAGMVLLIACANIANLMLVRGLARRGETSIRMALGAARGRVVRQMLTESVVLACFGGVAGLLLAYAGTKLLLGLMFSRAAVMPVDAAPSLPVLGFAFGVSLLTGLIFGVAPAWITSREQPANAMRGVNRSTQDGSSLLQQSLVILQAALSVVLLVGAGLLGKSLNRLQHQDLGLEVENRVVINMNPLKAGYKPEQLQGLYQQIEDKFHAMPGVEHVGLTMYSPLEGHRWSLYVYVQGQRPPDPGKDIDSIMDRASPSTSSRLDSVWCEGAHLRQTIRRRRRALRWSIRHSSKSFSIRAKIRLDGISVRTMFRTPVISRSWVWLRMRSITIRAMLFIRCTSCPCCSSRRRVRQRNWILRSTRRRWCCR